jgi:hypothetical protein
MNWNLIDRNSSQSLRGGFAQEERRLDSFESYGLRHN